MKDHKRRQNVWRVFDEQGPQAALEAAFENERTTVYHLRGDEDKIFAWQSLMGNHGLHRYGRFANIRRSELVGREYVIELSACGCGIAIFWTDVVHDPKTCRAVPKSSLAPGDLDFA